MPEVSVAVIQASVVKDVIVHADIIVVLVLVDFVVPVRVGVGVGVGEGVAAISSSEVVPVTLLRIVLSLSSQNRVITGHTGLSASGAW